MEKKTKQAGEAVSATELLDELFNRTLTDATKFDQEVASLIKQHLGSASPHSRAGNNLAGALVALAKKRAGEDEK